MRFFEKISFEQFKKDVSDNLELYNDIKLPKRSTLYSAGYDIFVIRDITIHVGEMLKIPTGIKVKMNHDEFLGVYIRSGLGTKNNVRMCNQTGIIDSDYYNNNGNEGHIWVVLQNEGNTDVNLKKGDHFVQGIFQKYFLVENDEANTQVRHGGFGSTNKGVKNNE